MSTIGGWLQATGTGGQGSQSLWTRVDLPTGATIESASDAISADYYLYDATEGLFGGLQLRGTAAGKSRCFYTSLAPSTVPTIGSTVLLSDFLPAVEGETLTVGDTLTSIGGSVFVVSGNALYLDNVTRSTVPEPTMLVALGAALLLMRRRAD